MRELLRAKARANMERAGIRRINATRVRYANFMVMSHPSFFSTDWRNWIK